MPLALMPRGKCPVCRCPPQDRRHHADRGVFPVVVEGEGKGSAARPGVLLSRLSAVLRLHPKQADEVQSMEVALLCIIIIG